MVDAGDSKSPSRKTVRVQVPPPAPMEQKPKVLVIVGPTASGKTSLSIQLAKKYNGEIISADSRQVYRGLDLGTGKVTQEEMDGVPHHLLDVADPNETYTVADFVRDGDNAIADTTSRGRLPIIVGGTFLYVDALLGKVNMPEVPPDAALRAALEALPTDTLIERLTALDPARAATIDVNNRRRLIRAIEVATTLGSVPATTPHMKYNALTLGILIPQETLHQNIHERLRTRLEVGMIEEVKGLHLQGLSFERMGDLGLEYRYIARHLQGKITYEEMFTELETKTRQYAKRQMTWLKRNDEIVWVEPSDMEKADTLVKGFLI